MDDDSELTQARVLNALAELNPTCCTTKINAYIVRGVAPEPDGALTNVIASITGQALLHGWNTFMFSSQVCPAPRGCRTPSMPHFAPLSSQLRHFISGLNATFWYLGEIALTQTETYED